MKTYARIQDGLVVELISLEDDQDIKDMFHPSMIWVQVNESDGVCEGWVASYANDTWAFTAWTGPTLSPEETLSMNKVTQTTLQAQASESMTPLLLSLQLGDATEEETALAKKWQAYSRALKTVDLTAKNPKWPSVPA
ncbi:tail fiber assembly protein [Pseudomonas glycinae]|uniref:tail fiber assembly protein n=1 Tax=Pseudomonas glycinae TaxID=1785145 RepID=UPI0018D6B0F7|nr:tail fiber assembly protein [Pseudomonas glycinae]MBH3405684.1 tail fiber assembly protein [Pseudomonas glycinae]